MCGSVVDIQSATAQIRRGKKKKKEEEEQDRRNHRTKIEWPALLGGHNKTKKNFVTKLSALGAVRAASVYRQTSAPREKRRMENVMTESGDWWSTDCRCLCPRHGAARCARTAPHSNPTHQHSSLSFCRSIYSARFAPCFFHTSRQLKSPFKKGKGFPYSIRLTVRPSHRCMHCVKTDEQNELILTSTIAR